MLTKNQRSYAQNRINGLNQTQAAIAAGYSERTATPAASRLEKDKAVIAHMARLRAKEPEPLEAVRTVKSKPAPRLKPVVVKKVSQKKTEQVAVNIDKVEKDIVAIPDIHSNVSMGDLPPPLAHMFYVMNDPAECPRLRMDAAKALASFTVAKPGEMGKKESQAKTAQEAATGKFAASAPPRLVARNG